MPVILAVDLGGSSLRCALIGRDGAVLALHAVAHDMNATTDVDPETWWAGLRAGAEALRAAAPAAFAGVAAIAISAFTRSLVLVDEAGTPLRPAILWHDVRAESAVPALLARMPPDHPERAQITAFHPLARLAWLGPVLGAHALLEPKDWLNFRLTGRIASDPVSATRLAACAALLPGLGMPALLPPLLSPRAIMGRTQPGLPGALAALAGVPVLAMAHDTWAAVIGLGAMRVGHAYCISGTTEVLGLLHDAPAQAPGLLTVEWDGLWQIGGPSQHGADALAWLAGLGVDVADPAPAEPTPILFLPALTGERTPHWDSALRGAFLGLHRSHGAADLSRAVMQGVALTNRSVLSRAEDASGRIATELRLGGGGATPGWAQLRADILGRPVVLMQAREPGLLGCAITAFATLEGVSLLAMQDALARPSARLLPDPARHAEASRLHALFVQAEAAVAPISRQLART